MKERHFRQMLQAQWNRGNFVCVGLDSEYNKIPSLIKIRCSSLTPHAITAFNQAIVDATHDLVCAYKPNIAFYEAYGTDGITALRDTIMDIHTIAPDVPVILDAKRADIGNTNIGYIQAAFEYFQADAITVNPYFGAEALKPFLDRADKGIIVLCRTSNPGAGEFQDLCVADVPLYKIVALRVANNWNKHDNCALVVGATYPNELRAVRDIVGDMTLLIPGVGEQGGDVEQTVTAGQNSQGQGIIVNSARKIIFASSGDDFAQAARQETVKLRDLINQHRKVDQP
jgi:orotidine-5'-phosphate decarboxylase